MLNRLQQHKMEKTPRYTQRERNMVLNFAAQYKDIIENKRTDAESNRKKDEVWRTIAREFNARVYHQRTAKQLRQLYKNMKLLLKKDLSGDGRSKNFIDILNALSQQAAFYPSMAFRQNYKSEYEDDQKGTSSFSSDNIENDVMVIKSEDLSDNDQSVRNDMDDTISNKDIPEVCLEEDDEDYPDDNLNKIPSNECDSLLSLAIEERRRKIELLNAQIEYWKALTRKLESTSSHCHCHMPRLNGVNQS